MELTGDLSDFALTDILQILALSRKTGTLTLEASGLSGRIIIESGRITYASVAPGEALCDRLVREQRISSQVMSELAKIGGDNGGVWTLDALIIESGVMGIEELESAARRHIQGVVGVLVGLEKGRFGIALNEADDFDVKSNIKLGEGLDVGEVLLGAAKQSDESGREVESFDSGLKDWLQSDATDSGKRSESDNEKSEIHKSLSSLGASSWFMGESGGRPSAYVGARAAILFSLLAEMRMYSFEAEVSLLVMRYASEVSSRGVLFVVKENEICGLGQFGVEAGCDGRSADERVRQIRIPLDCQNVFREVVLSGEPYIGNMPAGYWHEEMLGKIGTPMLEGLSVFVLPIMCQNRPLFIIYGDNYPGIGEMKGLDELVTLVNQGSIVLEKIVLERMVSEIRAKQV